MIVLRDLCHASRPKGWLAAPALALGANASATGQPQVFLTMTFSQPVLSVSPADIQVNLTETVALAPAESSSMQVCHPAVQLTLDISFLFRMLALSRQSQSQCCIYNVQGDSRSPSPWSNTGCTFTRRTGSWVSLF